MKSLFFILLATISLSATAADISCSREDDADDWRISGTFGAKTVVLFDNDSESEFKLKGVLESMPPVYVYEEVSNTNNVIKIKPSRMRQSIALAEYFNKKKPNDVIRFVCEVK